MNINLCLVVAVICIIYGSIDATSDSLPHLRSSLPITPPNISNTHTIPTAIDPDCCALCLLVTGECTGNLLGCPNAGAFLGAVSGLLYEVYAYATQDDTHE